MAHFNASPLTFLAGEAITQYALVKIESGTTADPAEVVETAGTQNADRAVVGVALTEAADGEYVSVWPLSLGGAVKVLAGDADLAVGDKLFTADDGKATDTTTSETCVGIALQASTAVTDIITMLCLPQTYDAVDAT